MKRILFAGDIVGSRGSEFAAKTVYELKGRERIDIVIVNGENSADGNGVTRVSAERLFSFADIVTTGNHCFRRKESEGLYDSTENLLRPANFPSGVQGHGMTVLDKGSFRLAVMNIMGTAFMEPLNNPFETAEELIARADTPNILIDLHAEATSEKKAMGQFLAGKVTAVIGTHTHVQTADETLLGGVTAYITDAGMCGAENSVLGIKTELAIQKQRYKIPVKFTESEEPRIFCGVIIDFDEKTGRACDIRRVQIREKV